MFLRRPSHPASATITVPRFGLVDSYYVVLGARDFASMIKLSTH